MKGNLRDFGALQWWLLIGAKAAKTASHKESKLNNAIVDHATVTYGISQDHYLLTTTMSVASEGKGIFYRFAHNIAKFHRTLS